MISNFFLKSKAWQLFLLYLGLFVLGGIFWSINLPKYLRQVIIPTISIVGVYWAYNLGINLHRKLQNKNNLKINLLIISLVTAYLLIAFPQYIAENYRSTMLLFGNGLYFYCVYFLSKTLVTVESGKDANFYEYGGTFFLVYMMPLGIFWLQPRINKIFLNNDGGA